LVLWIGPKESDVTMVAQHQATFLPFRLRIMLLNARTQGRSRDEAAQTQFESFRQCCLFQWGEGSIL